MSERKIVLVSACALIDTDNRVLLAQRPEGKSLHVAANCGTRWR